MILGVILFLSTSLSILQEIFSLCRYSNVTLSYMNGSARSLPPCFRQKAAPLLPYSPPKKVLPPPTSPPQIVPNCIFENTTKSDLRIWEGRGGGAGS